MTKAALPSETCDVAYALTIIGGKWKLFILWKLLDTPKRFSELRRTIPGISEPVLIAQLKELQQDSLVKRTDYKSMPPHVEYSLTERGQQLRTVLAQLKDWGGQQRLHASSNQIRPS